MFEASLGYIRSAWARFRSCLKKIKPNKSNKGQEIWVDSCTLCTMHCRQGEGPNYYRHKFKHRESDIEPDLIPNPEAVARGQRQTFIRKEVWKVES